MQATEQENILNKMKELSLSGTFDQVGNVENNGWFCLIKDFDLEVKDLGYDIKTDIKHVILRCDNQGFYNYLAFETYSDVDECWSEIVDRESLDARIEEIDWYKCPSRNKEYLQNYIWFGFHVGGFHKSLLENDLMGAITKADELNRQEIHSICLFIWNHFPPESHGSKEKVAKYMKSRRV